MKKNLKILFLINSLSIGGAEKNLINLANQINKTKKKIFITIISLGKIDKSYLKLLDKKIKIIEINIKSFSLIKLFYLFFLVKKIKPDIIHSWLYISDFISILLGKLLNIQNILWSIRCTNTIKHLSLISKFIFKILVFCSNKFPKVILSNSYQGKIDHIKAGYPKNKIQIINNGFRLDNLKFKKQAILKLKKQLKIKKNYKVIGTIGRNHPMKDHITFAKVAKKLLKKNSKLQFLIIGEGILNNENLLSFLKKNNLLKNFILRENTFRHDVNLFYSIMDIFCLTSSDSEGFSNVLVESILNKTIPISTKVGDSNLILKNNKNLLCKIKNDEEISKKIQRILSMNSLKRKKLIYILRKNISSYSIENITKKYLKIYEDLIFDKKLEKISVVPLSNNNSAPGDRRRFVGYMKLKKIKFSNYCKNRKSKIIFLTQAADITDWVKDKFSFLIYDLTDSYLSIDKTNLKGWLRGLAKFFVKQHKYLYFNYWKLLGNMCKRADMVICSTREQKKKISKYNKNVHIILDYKDVNINTFKKNYTIKGPKFKIVWEGLPQNIYLLNTIAKVIINLSKKYNIQMIVLSDLKYNYFLNKFWHIDSQKQLLNIFKNNKIFKLKEWKMNEYFKTILNCDLAVIPTDIDDKFISGKPENKLLLFWRLGLPVLTTNSVAYTRAMKSAQLKNLCSNELEWYNKIEKMIKMQSFRKYCGIKGRRFANTYYSNQVLTRQWNKIIDISQRKVKQNSYF